jgi:hypothetical protein
MPICIDIKIIWDKNFSMYTLYRHEIEEMMMNYDIKQPLLFTFVDPETIRQWMWDVFCREPKRIEIVEINY